MADARLIAHLIELGASESQVAGLDEGELIGLAGDLKLAAGLERTLEEVARAAECSVDQVRSIYEQLGLRADDLAGFGDDDVALVSRIVHDASGIVDQVGPQILRVIGTVLTRLAEAMIAAYVQDIEPQDRGRVDLVEVADQNALGSTLAVAVGDLLPAVLRHHMWTAVRRQRGDQVDVTAPEFVRIAIGFVDLVGFTGLTQSLSPADLIATIDDFERRAFQIATHQGGRIVKSIGDEVMIAASEPSVVASIVLELVRSNDGDRSVAPRGGISAGEVLFRLGDYYGSVVNIASRLVDEAVPGEVLTDLATIGTPGLMVHPAGRRSLKGFPEPVRVWSIESVE